jgi:hypothetical protein
MDHPSSEMSIRVHVTTHRNDQCFIGNLVEIDIPSTQFTQHGLKSVLTLTPRTPADFGKVVTVSVTCPVCVSVWYPNIIFSRNPTFLSNDNLEIDR